MTRIGKVTAGLKPLASTRYLFSAQLSIIWSISWSGIGVVPNLITY